MTLAQHEDRLSPSAIDAHWNRSYGRAVTPTVQVTGNLSQAAVAEIKESVSGLSSEERLALAREKLGLPRQIGDSEMIDDV